ncbi:hypothetical protein [Vibrio coralliilyticus]|uniref:Uncharacterized protein n=1 Tax=Vibrio coralliilyticus TaxID=190893 RepID=A0AAP6ZSW0_9VIBR|nr:hypothetical protein [Vibrio coralliilyticus]NOI31876.1 hypothetical protein [Vibrio coralliilyticus]NOJ25320.1 hypothetical protein [Vibrio coralliilyticus]
MANKEKRAKRAKLKAKQQRLAKQKTQQPNRVPQDLYVTDEGIHLVKQSFKEDLEKRLEKRLQSQSFDELTVGGSRIRFDMALAIDGYPFELPEGALEEDYEPLLSTDNYMSGMFDDVIDEVFNSALKRGKEHHP